MTVSLQRGNWFSCCTLFLLALLVPDFLQAEDIARLQAGVVKITAKPPSGTANIGTGFIVQLDKDAAYIVTAAHVVAGDQRPRVEFFTKRNVPVVAEVLGLEGDDEVRGFALLVARGAENLPNDLTALSLSAAALLTGGEDIVVIGFPRSAGPWAVVKGNISSRQGRDIFFSPSIDSGHSGGPIFHGGKVVGMVGSGSQSVGRGLTVRSVQDYIEGFGIGPQESTSMGGQTGSILVRVDEKVFNKAGEELPIVFYKANLIYLEQVDLDSVKLAVINPQSVLEQSRAGRRALEGLKEYVSIRQKILKVDEEELRKQEEILKGNARNMSDSQKRSAEQMFKDRVQQYQRKAEGFNAELQRKQNELVAEYRNRIMNAVRSVAEKERWDLVIDNFETSRPETKQEMMELLSADIRNILKRNNPNITAAVIGEFDRMYK